MGTMFGSLIPDIDAPHSEFSRRFISQKVLSDFLSAFLSLLLGVFILQNISYENLFFFIILFALSFNLFKLFFKFNLKKYFVHRGFAHSLWSLLIINIFLILPQTSLQKFPTFINSFYNAIVWGINIGYISHLIGDSLTFSGIRLFYPINFKISFSLFRTGGLMERILFYVFNAINIMLLTNYIVMGGIK